MTNFFIKVLFLVILSLALSCSEEDKLKQEQVTQTTQANVQQGNSLAQQ